MKKVLVFAMSLALLAGALAGCGNKPAETDEAAAIAVDTGNLNSNFEPMQVNEDVTGSFSYWSYTDTAENLVGAFLQMYPNVDVELNLYSGDEYKTKLLTTIQSGKNIPDLFDLEEGYAYEFFESDAVEDLGSRGLTEYMADMYGYITAGSKATDGTLKGVTFQTSPVGFWYLRSEMEKWLGTSDPDELAAMLNSWDAIRRVAEQVKTDSNGEVYLWPNIVEMVKVVGYSFQPLVRNNHFEATQDWYDLIETMRDFYDSGVTADLGSWSEQWAASWNEGELLIRVMPSWDFFTDEKNNGNIGIIKPFENAYEGATIVSMYSGSENKDVADLFLQFLCSDEWQLFNMGEHEQVPAKVSVAQMLAQDYSSERFGGQNLMQTYDEINAGIEDITPDRYTRAVQNIFQRMANEGVREGLSAEQIIENVKEKVREDYPEITGVA